MFVTQQLVNDNALWNMKFDAWCNLRMPHSSITSRPHFRETAFPAWLTLSQSVCSLSCYKIIFVRITVWEYLPWMPYGTFTLKRTVMPFHFERWIPDASVFLLIYVCRTRVFYCWTYHLFNYLNIVLTRKYI